MNESASCTGKHRFETKGEAVRSLSKSYGPRARRRGVRLMAYRCPGCHGFHIGSTARE